ARKEARHPWALVDDEEGTRGGDRQAAVGGKKGSGKKGSNRCSGLRKIGSTPFSPFSPLALRPRGLEGFLELLEREGLRHVRVAARGARGLAVRLLAPAR